MRYDFTRLSPEQFEEMAVSEIPERGNQGR